MSSIRSTPGAPRVETRGQTVLRVDPEPLALNLAVVVDLLWFLSLWALCVHFGRISPLPGFWTGGVFLMLYGFTLWIQLRKLQSTFGQWIWKMRLIETEAPENSPKGKKSVRWMSRVRIDRVRRFRLVQQEQLTPAVRARAALLSGAFLVLAGFVVARDILAHPMIQRVSVEQLTPLVPAQSEQAQREWATVPFFYALGAWPKRVFGDPVFYSLPYQVGPPSRFLGKIIARWKMPDIQLILEGPKSPTHKIPREQLKSCFTSVFLACPMLRSAALDRHISELAAAGAQDWEISWFEVKDTPGAPEAPPQGIKLVGFGPSWAQERWVLVTPQGTHQAIILQRPRSPEGEEASKLVKQMMRTLRVSDSLNFGQSLAALRVSEIDLGKFQSSLESPDLSLQLAGVQAALVAKASVDPGDLDAFFHLGGTSVLLLTHIEAMRNTLNGAVSSDKLGTLLQEWSSAAKSMIHSASLFANDIDSDNGKTRLLHAMAKESEGMR